MSCIVWRLRTDCMVYMMYTSPQLGALRISHVPYISFRFSLFRILAVTKRKYRERWENKCNLFFSKIVKACISLVEVGALSNHIILCVCVLSFCVFRFASKPMRFFHNTQYRNKLYMRKGSGGSQVAVIVLWILMELKKKKKKKIEFPQICLKWVFVFSAGVV